MPEFHPHRYWIRMSRGGSSHAGCFENELNDPAKPQTCSRRLETLDPLDHKGLSLRFGSCNSSSGPVLEQDWEAIVMHQTFCVPTQGVDPICTSRLGPEL